MASRFGPLHLSRQVCVDPCTQRHTLPGNAVLPPHGGMIITRGLQELACLLPQDLCFEPVARLLGWQTHEDQVLSATTIRSLVRTHGQIIHQAEQAEVAALAQRDDLATLRPQLMPLTAPRRRAGWPKELSAAVDLGLAAGAERPPQGIRQADWERVLDARRQEASLTREHLRHLGPILEPDQVLLTIDAVLTRTPQAHQFGEIRTARLTTAEGTRCLSGTGDTFLQSLRVLTLLSVGPGRSLLLLADGARWIRAFWRTLVTPLPTTLMILDWWHLRQKCAELGSRICHGHRAKERFLLQLQRRLWRGDVEGPVPLWRRTGPRPGTPRSWRSCSPTCVPGASFCPTIGSATSRVSTSAVGTPRNSMICSWPAAKRDRAATGHRRRAMRWPHCARCCSTVAGIGTGSSRCYRCLPVDPALMRANSRCGIMTIGRDYGKNGR